jgi:alkaline phosphatase
VGLIGLLVGLVTGALLPAATRPQSQSRPTALAAGAKSVILIVGDGMGAAQREAGRLRLLGPDGQLQMDQLTVSGSLTTDSRDPNTYLTDSAAAATAWATGVKTYNGAISVDFQGRPLPILGELAKTSGRSTGLVTSSQVTDATPAAFFAQTASRGLQSEIARQYVRESKPDVILGGGEDWWYPAGTPGAYPDAPAVDPSEKSRGTAGNLVDEAKQSGYRYVTTAEQLQATTSGKVLGLFANEEMFEARAEGKGDVYTPVVTPARMALTALNLLGQDPEGFFLVVEEEGIDGFGHQNNGGKVLAAMSRLDDTVAVARTYVAAHPDTLLVVAGDHETGGLTVEGSRNSDESGSGSIEDGPFPIRGSTKQFYLDWTTTSHTGVALPMSAEGPGASELTGQHPNTFVHGVLAKVLG